jgi:hypothetical protein
VWVGGTFTVTSPVIIRAGFGQFTVGACDLGHHSWFAATDSPCRQVDRVSRYGGSSEPTGAGLFVQIGYGFGRDWCVLSPLSPDQVSSQIASSLILAVMICMYIQGRRLCAWRGSGSGCRYGYHALGRRWPRPHGQRSGV